MIVQAAGKPQYASELTSTYLHHVGFGAWIASPKMQEDLEPEDAEKLSAEDSPDEHEEIHEVAYSSKWWHGNKSSFWIQEIHCWAMSLWLRIDLELTWIHQTRSCTRWMVMLTNCFMGRLSKIPMKQRSGRSQRRRSENQRFEGTGGGQKNTERDRWRRLFDSRVECFAHHQCKCRFATWRVYFLLWQKEVLIRGKDWTALTAECDALLESCKRPWVAVQLVVLYVFWMSKHRWTSAKHLTVTQIQWKEWTFFLTHECTN